MMIDKYGVQPYIVSAVSKEKGFRSRSSESRPQWEFLSCAFFVYSLPRSFRFDFVFGLAASK